MKVHELLEAEGYDPKFKMLDGTNPAKPYTQAEILKAMSQLHARVHRQADNYGGNPLKGVNNKTGKVNTSGHKFYDAQIAPDE